MLRRLSRPSALSRRRLAAGWALAAVGPVALGAALAMTRSAHSTATELMLFLCLSVGVALVGGLAPALAAAVAGSAILNYFFTPPRYTWKIAEAEQALALVVFVLVATAVSVVVDLAERRRQLADRSRAESSTLSVLAGAVLRGEDTVPGLLGRLRETFAVPSASLQELQDGRWRVVAESGEQDAVAGTALEIRPGLRLRLGGAALSSDDHRVVTAFASHAAVVLDRERLREKADQAHRLEQGVAIRSALLAAVSHDLRTPLASIKAASSSLQLPGVDWPADERAQLVATIADGADRLQGLIDNLLDLTRLTTGVVDPVLTPVALEELTGPALRGVPGGRVDVDIPEGLPLISTDPGLLERVLANLVENAVRHSPSAVRLTATVADGRVQVDVADRGPGVAEQDRERMFEPFQRLGDSTSHGGAGLGLAVARGFAAAVGAGLWVRDTPGGGLTLRLSLPVA